MRSAIRQLTPTRYQFYPEAVSLFTPFPKVLPEGIEALQLDSPLTDAMWQRLAALMAEYPEVELRVYGGTDNLDFLRYFPTLRKLSADCLIHLRTFDGLRFATDSLRSIALGATLHKPSLHPLKELSSSLRELFIEGPVKGVEVLQHFDELRILSLRSITLADLSYLLPMTKLLSLDLKLGGTTNLGLLPNLQQLERLEIWMVRALEDISPIGQLGHLRTLHVESQKRVTQLPSFKELNALTTLTLWNMKGITDLDPLAEAPVLEKLRLVDMGHLRTHDLGPLLKIKNLKEADLGLNSVKRNEAAFDLLPLPRVGFIPRVETDVDGHAYWTER